MNYNPLPSSSQLYALSAHKLNSWLGSAECLQLIKELTISPAFQEASNAFLGKILDTRHVTPQMIAMRFVRGYLDVGTSSGNALKSDPVSQIILSKMSRRCRSDPAIAEACKLRETSPDLFEFMSQLIDIHSRIVRSVVRHAFQADNLVLRRGVADTRLISPIESWAYFGSVHSYGANTLIARVPVASILSLRGAEHELIVARPRRSTLRPGGFAMIRSPRLSRLIYTNLPKQRTWMPEDI
ncbi:hypothetical protein [Rathayibacter sp. Leaf248]|uniref:hypothetical protein n=1 Tax=Rathayibacter sp. Leaf248 TaxID=2876555 RepID=UPI001E4C175F|nr:hypothetical protein [Rathayibacter sp. Leaf248]